MRRESFAASLLPFQDLRRDHRTYQHGAGGIGAPHPDRGQGSYRTGTSVAASTPIRTQISISHLTLNFLLHGRGFLAALLDVAGAGEAPLASLVPAGRLTV